MITAVGLLILTVCTDRPFVPPYPSIAEGNVEAAREGRIAGVVEL